MTVTDPTPPALEDAAARLRSKAADVVTRVTGRPPLVDGDEAEPVDGTRDLVEIRDRRWRQVIPQRFHAAALADFDGTTGRDLAVWAALPKPPNLVLLGPVGPGKTRAAIAACRPAFDRGLEVRFFPVVELLDMLRPDAETPASFADLVDVDRLVLDDVGKEKATDWTHERLYAVINRRWMEERPMIVTANMEPDELEGAVGAAVFSRLVGDGAVVLRMAGKDRRRSRG